MQTEGAAIAEGFNALPTIMPLVGVLIGGGITFGYQSFFRWRDRKRLMRERLHRLHRFTAGLFNEILTLNKTVLGDVPAKLQGPLWHYMQPVVGHNTTPREYALDDLILLGGPMFVTLSNELPLLALERNAIVAALAEYNVRRTELLDAIAPHTTFGPNNTVMFDNAYKQVAKNVRLEAEVTALATALNSDIRTSRENAYKLAPLFNELLAHYYKKKKNNPRTDLPPK